MPTPALINTSGRAGVAGVRGFMTKLPRGAGTPGDAFVQRAVFDEFDQIVETVSVAPFRFRATRVFDATGRVDGE